MNELCHCGNVANITPVWHAWRVNWRNAPQEAAAFLNHAKICGDCKNKVKNILRDGCNQKLKTLLSME